MKRGRPTKRPGEKATRSAMAKATRIRAKLKNPLTKAHVKRADIEFLRAHEAAHPYTHRVNGGSVLEQLDERPSTRRSSSSSTRRLEPELEHEPEQPNNEPTPPTSQQEEQRFAVDFSEAKPKTEEKPDDDGGECPFGKDCPHCRNGVPKKNHVLGKCGTTGRVVYEPMSEQGARFFAGAVLNGMALAARVLRPDHALIEPDDEDYEDMTRGVRMTIDRRLPQLSAWDDLAQLGFAFGAFGRRALFDAAPAKLPPPRKLEAVK